MMQAERPKPKELSMIRFRLTSQKYKEVEDMSFFLNRHFLLKIPPKYRECPTMDMTNERAVNSSSAKFET